MANFTLLKGDCPICSGIRNGKRKADCKQSGELIHCFSHNNPPPGFRFVGQSAIGQSLYAPEREKGLDPEQHRAELAKLRAKHQAQAAARREQLPTIPERHQEILGYPAELTLTQNADLLRRGLDQAEIDFALSQHWLFACQGGYGITAVDAVSGMFCGAQRALDDRSQRKYDWALFAGRNQLKETDENPLFLWQSPDFDPSQPYELKFCEGALKSLIRAFLEWRHSPQVILIGAAGGNFGEQSLTRLLSVYSEVQKFTHFPDADSQNLKKKNLYAGYSKLVKAIPSVKFADWGQWRDKTKKDCDEYFGRYSRRSPWDWLKLFAFEDARKQAKEKLKTSDKLTPDKTITLAEFKALDAESLGRLTNGAQDIFLAAPTAAGKTRLAALVTRLWQRVIAPFPRISLARNAASRLGLQYRTDCDRLHGELVSFGADNYAVVSKIAYCNEGVLGLLHPINKLLKDGAFAFGDEFDQQLENLTLSATHGKAGRRRLHTDTFWKVFRESQKALCVSADLTDYEVNLYHRTTGRKPFVLQVITEQKPQTVTVYETQTQFWQQFKTLREAEQRILVLCTRKSDAQFLAHSFGATAISADNAKEYEAFLNDPDPWLAQHKPQLMAVTPILGTGFNIEGDHFDAVMLLGHADNIPAKGLMQFLARYRPHVPRLIWCAETNHRFDAITREAIYQNRLTKAKTNRAITHELNYLDPDDPYFYYKARVNWSLAHLRADLLARLEQDVTTVIYELCHLPEKEMNRIEGEINALRKDFADVWYQHRHGADNLTAAEYQMLKKDEKNLSESQRWALEKYEIAAWAGKSPDQLDLDYIRRDHKGNKRRALEKLEMQAIPDLAIALDQHSVNKQVQYGAICQQDITHHYLRVQVLDDWGIGEFLDHALSGQEWHGEHPIILALAESWTVFRDELAKYGVKLSCGKNASPAAIVGALLRFFGLKSVSRRSRQGDRLLRIYRLDEKDWEISKADLVARLPLNIEKFGPLTPVLESQWITEIYSQSTPLENIENTEVWISTETTTQLGIEALSPEPEPKKTAPTGQFQEFVYRIREKMSFWDGNQPLIGVIQQTLTGEIPEYRVAGGNGWEFFIPETWIHLLGGAV